MKLILINVRLIDQQIIKSRNINNKFIKNKLDIYSSILFLLKRYKEIQYLSCRFKNQAYSILIQKLTIENNINKLDIYRVF